MNNVCVLYIKNDLYARRLLHGFSQRGNMKYGVLLFTQIDELEKYLKDNMPGVVLLCEEDYSEEYAGIVQRFYNGKQVILTEEQNKQEKVTDDFGSNTVGIYRYQPLDKILKQVADMMNFQNTPKLSETDIIGIYSPACVPERPGFALNMAKILSEQYRTLYLSLEEFSGLDQILPSEPGENLSDALYYYRQGQQAANEKIAGTIRSIADLDYIAPVRCAEDIHYLEADQIVEFICNIGKYNHYEVILLDISSAVCSPWQIMDCCSAIYFPVKEDYLSEKKISAFETYFMDIGMEYLFDRIVKVKLPEGESSVEADFWTKMVFGGMYRYVKKLLEKREEYV